MHIAIFLDQHLETLGGVQTSVKLQRKYLEKLGHRVTICSPSSLNKKQDEHFVITPSYPLAGKGEYHFTIPSKKVERHIDEAFNALPPVDVVHVQADYWGAILGLSFARRHDIPSLITFHNNVQFGLDSVLGRSAGRLFIWWMSTFSHRFLKRKLLGHRTDPWDYLKNLALQADTLLTPTKHFARTLKSHGVAKKVLVMSNGIDDELLQLSHHKATNKVPVFLWTGRLSQEKRLFEYIEAIHKADIRARFVIYGNGNTFQPAARLIAKYELSNKVFLNHAVPYKKILEIFASSDVLVQTSIGFETQGMTVFEALSLGTPVILSDPLIAEDLPREAYWIVADSSTDALAATMRQAYDDIISGRRSQVSLTKEYDFRQSSMTAKAVNYYEDTIKSHKIRVGSKV